jgi:hypothetical protein
MDCLPRITRSGALLLDDALEQLGDDQRLDAALGLDLDAAIGAEGQGRADLLLAALVADGDGDDLRRRAGLLQAHGLLDGDFAEGIDRHFDVVQIDV